MKGWPDTLSNSIRLKPHFSVPCTRKRASEVEHRLTAGATVGDPIWGILITIPVFPRLAIYPSIRGHEKVLGGHAIGK